jgi:hypothetical protein
MDRRIMRLEDTAKALGSSAGAADEFARDSCFIWM